MSEKKIENMTLAEMGKAFWSKLGWFSRLLWGIGSFKNEVLLIATSVLLLFSLHKGIDYWNQNEVGAQITKWDLSYTVVSFYAMASLSLIIGFSKLIFFLLSPAVARFMEKEFVETFKIIAPWLRIVISLFMLFAYVFGIIWLTVSQMAALQSL